MNLAKAHARWFDDQFAAHRPGAKKIRNQRQVVEE
jgi:hypothetical protein